MTSKVFVTRFLLFLGIIVVGVASTMMYLDPFGLYRDPAGRQIALKRNERMGKYLLSFRYVPANFDSILIGSSASDNLDPSAVRGLTMYNFSIDGGNMSEEKILVENYLARASPKLVLIALHPYLFQSHGRKTAFMVSKQLSSTLGSPQLLFHYLAAWGIEAGYLPDLNRPNGQYRFDRLPAEAAVEQWIAGAKARQAPMTLDPAAIGEFRRLVQALRSRRVPVFAFYLPVPEAYLAFVSEEESTFRKALSGILGPSDILVDFNSTSFTGFREEVSNFRDHAHLSSKGAEFVMGVVNRAVAPRVALGRSTH